MLSGVIIVVLASIAMVLFRIIIGPSIFDRILGMNSLTAHIIVFTALLGLFTQTSFLIDIAIIYALTSFVTTVAFLMYFKYRTEEE